MNKKVIINTNFDVVKTTDIMFDYNIKDTVNYGICLFFNHNLSWQYDDLKNKNKTIDDGFGLYGNSKNSIIGAKFAIGLDNKGQFAKKTKIIDGKNELNGYPTITTRCFNGNNYYKYVNDQRIDDFNTVDSSSFNTLRFILSERGTRINVLFKTSVDTDLKNVYEIKLPGNILEYNNKHSIYNVGICGMHDKNGCISIKNLYISN